MSTITAVRRCGAVVAGATLLLAALGWAMSGFWPHRPALLGPPSRVYAVSELFIGLAHNPGRWIGTTVWVQGVMLGADWRGRWVIVAPPRLADPDDMTVDVPLTMSMDRPAWAWLRRLPLIGDALLSTQTVQWDRLAAYRIQLRAVPGRASPHCYDAVLLDVT